MTHVTCGKHQKQTIEQRHGVGTSQVPQQIRGRVRVSQLISRLDGNGFNVAFTLTWSSQFKVEHWNLGLS